ncbi:PREDICTED: ARL14 effector protein-like [Nicrophorus vespilloides]|uniref:ARL14 effector protein-like n=1 Tax=Nicrophorus vespilloides TaxID=110193 RepID=A0ABM1ME46_NICVS|nr:PREDICTED: ARL14 effector protein-like [Nicrophorus vespilloides]
MESDDSNATSAGASTASGVSTDELRITRSSSMCLAKKSTGAGLQESFVSGKPAITRRQIAIANKEKIKFLGNFNPETSEREKRKLMKKIQTRKGNGALYNNKGIHNATGRDLCDCLEPECPGCFYPCKKCGSTKCGVDCRCMRKFKYDSIEYHGYSFTKKNPLNEEP